jgi:hypothetical protein
VLGRATSCALSRPALQSVATRRGPPYHDRRGGSCARRGAAQASRRALRCRLPPCQAHLPRPAARTPRRSGPPPPFVSLASKALLSRAYKRGSCSVPARARHRPGRHGCSRAELSARYLPSTVQTPSTSARTHGDGPSHRPTRLGR